jgi:hypothetical protein
MQVYDIYSNWIKEIFCVDSRINLVTNLLTNLIPYSLPIVSHSLNLILKVYYFKYSFSPLCCCSYSFINLLLRLRFSHIQ